VEEALVDYLLVLLVLKRDEREACYAPLIPIYARDEAQTQLTKPTTIGVGSAESARP